MNYQSPLGYNFKLQESLSASKEEKVKETPKRDEHIRSKNSGKKIFHDHRNSGGSYSSPTWQRHNYSRNSPNHRNTPQHNDTSSIEQYYHPSMLENPWEELERNLQET